MMLWSEYKYRHALELSKVPHLGNFFSFEKSYSNHSLFWVQNLLSHWISIERNLGKFFLKDFILWILQTRTQKNSVWSVNYTHGHVILIFFVGC